MLRSHLGKLNVAADLETIQNEFNKEGSGGETAKSKDIDRNNQNPKQFNRQGTSDLPSLESSTNLRRQMETNVGVIGRENICAFLKLGLSLKKMVSS